MIEVRGDGAASREPAQECHLVYGPTTGDVNEDGARLAGADALRIPEGFRLLRERKQAHHEIRPLEERREFPAAGGIQRAPYRPIVPSSHAGHVHLEGARDRGDLDSNGAHADDQEVLPRDRFRGPPLPAPLRHPAQRLVDPERPREDVAEHVLRDALGEIADRARQEDLFGPFRPREPVLDPGPPALDPAKLRKPERSFGGSTRAEPDRCLLEAGRVETRPVERLPDRLLHGPREPLRIGARDEDPVAHAEDLDAAPASRDGRVARWIPY